MEYTVLDDVVIAASRIEALNKQFGSSVLTWNEVSRPMHRRRRMSAIEAVPLSGAPSRRP